VYLVRGIKGLGKTTWLSSLLKNSVNGLNVKTSEGMRNASEFSLSAWWNMVFYLNNLAGLQFMDRDKLFKEYRSIAEAIGLTNEDVTSSGCSTGQGCLWALLSLLSMLPTDRGIVLILDELLSNVELPLRRIIYEHVLPKYFPRAIIIVVDHGYNVEEEEEDKTHVIDFANATHTLP
jgi:hypothetical protein